MVAQNIILLSFLDENTLLLSIKPATLDQMGKW